MDVLLEAYAFLFWRALTIPERIKNRGTLCLRISVGNRDYHYLSQNETVVSCVGQVLLGALEVLVFFLRLGTELSHFTREPLEIAIPCRTLR